MVEINGKSIQNVAKSIENFTADFHKKIASKEEGNFIKSALSAHFALAMTAYGARGNTALEMKKALHLPDDDSQAYQEFQNLIDAIDSVQKVVLKLANKVYIRNNTNVEDEFLKITSTYFRSQFGQMDVSQPAETAKIINQWCSEKTNAKIKELIKLNDINSLTVMVILNAVYFKGDWKNKFEKSKTRPEKFYVDKNTTIKVPTMQIKSNFFYKNLNKLNAQSIKIPYVNDDLVMEIIVPYEVDGLRYIEKNLEQINDGHGYMGEFILSLPKFKLETEIYLNELLKEMGMCDMFTSKADFSGIADLLLYLSKVRQKAFIEVNEEGSEAATVTAVIIRERSLPPRPREFNVDRPFLFRIIYKTIVLFSGRVINPLEK